MPTLKEQIKQLTSLKYREAVWEAVVQYLEENYLSKDGRPAQKGLRVPDGPGDQMVPEEVIEEIINQVGHGPLSDIRANIAHIENQEVVILKGERNEQKPS